ncbi:MAG: DUF262 domain-containing protein [Eubacteriales bacterium]
MTQEFSINAKTCTLKYNSQNPNDVVINDNILYVVPVYQRPYSWTEEQIRKFILDLFFSYWGNDGNANWEPLFVGTMQLSTQNSLQEQEVIDGQQRLTTFILILFILKQKFPNNRELSDLEFKWLNTRVNSGKQQSYLEELLNSKWERNDETLNPYLINSYIINDIIEEQIKDDEGNTIPFDDNSFVKHLLSNIYFVIIETKAGLTKTLQIFNAINTTGLDLNGGDVFKIRMFEYLVNYKGESEEVFDRISNLYKDIDERNGVLKYNATNIIGVLNIYQFILIAKYELPVALYSLATETFFERLFETKFKINQWENFKNNIDRIELSLDDIERIIKVRYEWENSHYPTLEDACAQNLIWWSRYGRYWIVIFVFLYKFVDEDDYLNKSFAFVRQLNKLYFIYSVRFQKAVNEIHTFTYSLIKTISSKGFDEVMTFIKTKIGTVENHNQGWYDLDWFLVENLTDNSKRKNLICRLSGMLEEDYKTTDQEKIGNVKHMLFEFPVDIEHVQSYHDSDGERREDIWKEWGDNINSLGNLIILEQDINRSISNKPYDLKIEQYQESKFKIVQKQVENHKEWSLTKCLERKMNEKNKLENYLFT